MAGLKDVIDTLDKAADGFGNIANQEQKKIYEEVVTLAKDLETDMRGRVKQTISNLKRLNQIKAKLAALSKDKEWVAGITQFAKYFDILQRQQNAYFSQQFGKKTLTESAQKKNEIMRQIAVQNTMEALMGDGLKANVLDKLNDILLRGVTSGAKWADLQDELRTHLMGKEGGQGAFARYATTYATTALSQYTGQHNKLLSDGLDTEWYMYTGSNKETTREFCEQLTKKKYIHKSEIPTILKGKIEMPDGEVVEVPLYPKTNLPYGMIEGTTPENFQCNCGGWNCRHQLVPVADAVVPKSIRDRIERMNSRKVERTEYDKFMEDNGRFVAILKKWQTIYPDMDLDVFNDKNAKTGDLFSARLKATKILFNHRTEDYKIVDSLKQLRETARKAGKAHEVDKINNALKNYDITFTHDVVNDYVPQSLSEYKQRIAMLKKTYESVHAALTPKANTTQTNANKAVQTKEITSAQLGIKDEDTEELEELARKIRIDYMTKQLNISPKKAASYVDDIKWYTFELYEYVRAAQQGRSNDKESKRMGNNIDEFVAISPKWAGGTTYRGININEVELNKLKGSHGKPITMYGTSSWSVSKGTAHLFARGNNDIEVIFVCKNAQPQGTSISWLSAYGESEQEILVSSKAKWKITNIQQPDKKNPNYYEITVQPFE